MADQLKPPIPKADLGRIETGLNVVQTGKLHNGRPLPEGVEKFVRKSKEEARQLEQVLEPTFRKVANSGLVDVDISTQTEKEMGSMLYRSVVAACSEVLAKPEARLDEVAAAEVVGLGSLDELTVDSVRERWKIAKTREVVRAAKTREGDVNVDKEIDSVTGEVVSTLRRVAQEKGARLTRPDVDVIFQICEEKVESMVDADHQARQAAKRLIAQGAETSQKVAAVLLEREAIARFDADKAVVESVASCVLTKEGALGKIIKALSRGQQEIQIPGVNIPSAEKLAQMKKQAAQSQKPFRRGEKRLLQMTLVKAQLISPRRV